jgi:alkanesulfonate monooxygenase SsuD/methylene tetrahydromethanopterin reductase-like flavin-dependent oxidoreductase (luciferase family)
MKFAFSFANFGYLGDVRTLVDLAVDAEVAGWDAVFLWDHVNWPDMGFHVDPWITLGLIADRTERVLVSTSITPIARRRPTKLAREILTLHQISDGRFVFGAGNGLWPNEFDDLGDAADLKVRAEMLDEGLELLQSLWSGESVDHQGTHYRAKAQTFAPGGAEIPVWLGASWPNQKPIRRAARFDGLVAINQDAATPLTPDQVAEVSGWIAESRTSDAPFNLGFCTYSSDDAQADAVRAQAYVTAGASWWVDVSNPVEALEDLRTRVRHGPPRI